MLSHGTVPPSVSLTRSLASPEVGSAGAPYARAGALGGAPAGLAVITGPGTEGYFADLRYLLKA